MVVILEKMVHAKLLLDAFALWESVSMCINTLTGVQFSSVLMCTSLNS